MGLPKKSVGHLISAHPAKNHLQDQHRQDTKFPVMKVPLNLAKVLEVKPAVCLLLHHNPRKNLVVEFLRANRLIQEVQQSNHLLPRNHQVQASLIHSHPLHPLAVKQALNLSRKKQVQKNHLESSRLGHLQSPHRAKKNQQANPRVLQDQHLHQNTKHLAEKNLAKVLKVNHHNPRKNLVVEFIRANRLIQEVQQSNHLLPKNHQVQASLIHSHPLHPLAVKQALNLSRKQVHQKSHLESSRLGHLQSPHRAKKNQQANPRVLQDQHLRQNTKNLAEKNLAKVLKV